MDGCIRAGIYGASLSLLFGLFFSNLYFIPSFFATILMIYVSRLLTLREGLVTSFMTYVFSDGILTTIAAAIYFFTDEPYVLTVDIWVVILPLASAFSAIIAAYVGVRLAQKAKPVQELPQSLPPPLPPV